MFGEYGFGEAPFGATEVEEDAPPIDPVDPDVPVSVYTRNAGNGSMEVIWAHPESGPADYYEVWIAPASGGPFEKANREPVTGRVTRVINLPFGSTIFTKVRGVSSGEPGPFSELAGDATCGRAVGELVFEGPIGDIIAAEGIFTSFVAEELLAVRVSSEETITG